MIISDGKIIEATELELYDYWLRLGLDDLFSFPDYVKSMKRVGVKVIGENMRSRFNPCRYCGGNDQVFNFLEVHECAGKRHFSDFEVVCHCGNRTINPAHSFDTALEEWNRENPAETEGIK